MNKTRLSSSSDVILRKRQQGTFVRYNALIASGKLPSGSIPASDLYDIAHATRQYNDQPDQTVCILCTPTFNLNNITELTNIGGGGGGGIGGGSGPSNPGIVVTFSSGSTSATVPAGVTSGTIYVVGAGGGAAGVGTSFVGGAGLFIYATFNVSPGDSYTVYVGAQGQEGNYGTNAGVAGGGGGGGASAVVFNTTTKYIIAGGGGGGGIVQNGFSYNSITGGFYSGSGFGGSSFAGFGAGGGGGINSAGDNGNYGGGGRQFGGAGGTTNVTAIGGYGGGGAGGGVRGQGGDGGGGGGYTGGNGGRVSSGPTGAGGFAGTSFSTGQANGGTTAAPYVPQTIGGIVFPSTVGGPGNPGYIVVVFL